MIPSDLFAENFRFAEPQRLTLLWGLLPAFLLLWWRDRRRGFRVGSPVALRRAAPPGVGLLRAGFRVGLLALCLLAFARPQAGTEKREEKKPLTDLMVALDVSHSMLADDLPPSRITAAKQILAEFLGRVEGVRVGLVVFAGRSFTQCPLTHDLSAVRTLLGKVEVFSVRVDGTAIGDALASSLNRLRKGAVPGEEGDGTGRAIVLITDGENNQGTVDPLTAARLAARERVRVYAVGVGTPEGVPTPYMLPDGRVTYALDRRGNVIRTRLDEGLLKEVASLTGGKYFPAADKATLSRVLKEIARLEKREVVVRSDWDWRELAPALLAAVFVLLLAERLAAWSFLRTLP